MGFVAPVVRFFFFFSFFFLVPSPALTTPQPISLCFSPSLVVTSYASPSPSLSLSAVSFQVDLSYEC